MLLLAAVQSFCGRFADALLTTMAPLTYERGDALMAFEEENEVHEAGFYCTRCTKRIGESAAVSKIVPGMFCSHYCAACAEVDHDPMCHFCFGPRTECTHAYREVFAPDPPGAVEAPAPAPGFSLPMYKADDLAEIAAEYIVRIPTVSNQVAKATAELIISHLTYELQSLVYEQNNPQAPQ